MTDEATIRQLLDGFANAFRAKDVDGVMSIFAPEIVSYDILPPLQTAGAGTFVTHWREFFGSHQGPIEVEFPDITVAASNDVAFSHCLHRIKGTLKTGQPTDWWLRWTACWRKTSGKWLVVHEHVSVPIDVRTGTAFMDLEPNPVGAM